jgi:ribonuclease BN (tRNA processing enzyme)
VNLTFLGTGGAFCDYRVNYQNNGLVETAEGPVMIDCGTTACQSLRELGRSPLEIRAVLLTHLHADHASPEQLIWERYYSSPDYIPRYLPTELIGPADVVGPIGGALQPFLDEFTDATGLVRHGGLETLVRRRAATEVEIGGLRFRWFRVPHVEGAGVSKAAYGIEIDDGQKRIVWSGDTTFSPRWVLEAFQSGRVERIFHECLFLPPFPGTVHTHYSELMTLPEEVLRRITLMHYTQVPAGLELGALEGAALRHQRYRF